MLPINERIRDFYRGKTVLITGASGYIASNLLCVLSDFDCKIIRLSRNKLPLCQAVSKIKDFEGDIQKLETWKKVLTNVDIVFHLASQTSVYKAQNDPRKDWNNNTLPMLNLLEICRESKKKSTIIFSGTVTQAGLVKETPVTECVNDEPITVYDIHKLMAEAYLLLYCRQGHVKGASLRVPNVFGPGAKSNSGDRGVINMMVRKAMNGEQLTIYGHGEFLRDYLFIDDLVTALLLAGESIDKLNSEYFVLGTGVGHTIKESIGCVAAIVQKTIGKKVELVHIPPPQGLSPIESRNFLGDSEKFSNLTGWKPSVSFDEGIIKTMKSMD